MSSIFEVAQGPINGVNRVFSVSADYKPGTVRVWRNGVLLEKSLVDGFVEVGPKSFRMNEPPVLEDVLMAYFESIL